MKHEDSCPAPVVHERRVVAIVGAGLIGNSWAALFASAGHQVRLHDRDPEMLARAAARVDNATRDLVSIGIEPAKAGRVAFVGGLEEAVCGAHHVQECIVEAIGAKKAVFAAIRAVNGDAVLASSTSTFQPSTLFDDLDRREHTLIVHPLLPPHLIPVSELVPAPFTAPAAVEAAAALLASVGHQTILLKREIPGFVLNRLQFALLGEAMHLVDSGICDPADIDTALTAGLGLRWAAIGPFAQTHLNAPGGARGSLSGYRAAIEPVLRSLRPDHPWSEALIDRVDAAMRREVPEDGISAARATRDARIVALRGLSTCPDDAAPPASISPHTKADDPR